MRRYKAGSYVKVKPEDAAVRYRKPHLRVPGTASSSLKELQSRDCICTICPWLHADCMRTYFDMCIQMITLPTSPGA